MREQSELETSGGLNVRLILGLVATAALVLFVAQNGQDVEVKFLFWDGSLPLFFLLIVTAILTVLAAGTVFWLMRRRRNT